MASLAEEADALILALSNLKKHEKVSLKLLVNLSTQPQLASKIACSSIISQCKQIMSDRELLSLVIALLCNICRNPENCRLVVAVTGLVQDTLDLVTAQNPIPGEILQYFLPFLMNISQLEEARLFIQSKKEVIVPLVLENLTNRDSVLCKHGSFGVLRNLLLITEEHEWMFDRNILYHLLFPLVGPEDMDEEDKDGMIPEIASVVGKKARESDLTARKLAIESLFILTATLPGRERLIKAKTYPIVRNSDMVEEDEATQEIAYELVNVLILSEEQTKPPPMLEACSTETIQFPSNQK
eukprot:c8952_g1_i3.p1 GENE.c8952_g1_i3~~c8952_g1_i3.p1  ORF type:complete len:298 (-),score=56.57 c8952_g1_i3:34-927(-)